MNDPNRSLLEDAVRLLEPLLGELVFAGGCATGLLISDAASGGLRVTKDVDYIASEMRRLLDAHQFLDALPGFLLSDSASQGRQSLLRERLNALAQADT